MGCRPGNPEGHGSCRLTSAEQRLDLGQPGAKVFGQSLGGVRIGRLEQQLEPAQRPMGDPLRAPGEHVAVELAAGDGRMLYVPEGFAHGFCTLEPMTEVAYKVSADYAPEADAGIAWDDPALGIDWPVAPKDRRRTA